MCHMIYVHAMCDVTKELAAVLEKAPKCVLLSMFTAPIEMFFNCVFSDKVYILKIKTIHKLN